MILEEALKAGIRRLVYFAANESNILRPERNTLVSSAIDFEYIYTPQTNTRYPKTAWNCQGQ
jgi:hypothetical protein